MKKLGIILGIASSTLLIQAQKPLDKVAANTPVYDYQLKAQELNQEFNNLPKEQRIKYNTMRFEAHRLFARKRTFEALVQIYDMQAIFNRNPNTFNLLGAIRVEFRDFTSARELFRKAIDLTGEDPKILFNIAELAFCDNDWKSCLKELDYTLAKLKKDEIRARKNAIAKNQEPSKYSYLDSDFTRIMIFKQMLCHLALAQDEKISVEEQKNHTQKATDIAQKFDYMVDSPFHYYANAALEYSKNNETNASIWISTAKYVFSNSIGTTASWDDTLVEFGYIESHYGKHFKKD